MKKDIEIDLKNTKNDKLGLTFSFNPSLKLNDIVNCFESLVRQLKLQTNNYYKETKNPKDLNNLTIEDLSK